MIPPLPDEIEGFESFLKDRGGFFRNVKGPDEKYFGNMVLEFTCAGLGIALVLDRSEWSVQIGDESIDPAPWYREECIRELLLDKPAAFTSFAEQIKFIEDHWQSIVECFAPANRTVTHEKLRQIFEERRIRGWKIWPKVILDFEAFLQKAGLVCSCREAPQGVLGIKRMEYRGDNIVVRINGEEGWRLQITDVFSPPEIWYDIRIIRMFLTNSPEFNLPFAQWFVYAMENWPAIINMFSPEKRAESQKRLEYLRMNWKIISSNAKA